MKDLINQLKLPSLTTISSNFIYIIFSLLIGTIAGYILKLNQIWEISIFSLSTFFLLLLLTNKNKPVSHFTNAFISLGVFFIISLLAALIKGLFLDFSFDGQMYHQEAIILLKEGWNPIYHPFANLENTVYGISFYPKAIWYIQAYCFLLTDNLEASKIADILLASTVIFKTIPKLKTLRFSITQQIIIIVLICITPISISQFFSFYIDSSVYFLIILILLLGYEIEVKSNQRSDSIIQLILVSSILANTKFTGLYFSLIFTGGIFLYLIIKRKWSFFPILKSGLGILLLTILIGINPYITNLIEYRNPVYPMVNGAEEYDIIGSQMSENFANQPFLTKLYYSYFGVSSRMIPETKIEIRKLGIPHPNEVTQYINTGETTRINGFGLLYSLTFIISLLVLFKILLTNHNFNYFYLILLLIAVSTLLNPTSWWARLSPATYLFPVIVILILWSERKKVSRFTGYTLSCLLIINNIMIAGPVILSQITNQHIANQQLNLIRQGLKTSKNGILVDFSPMWNSAQQRLIDNNIPYSISKLENSKSYNLLNTPAHFNFIDSIPNELLISLNEFQHQSFKEHLKQLTKHNLTTN